MLTLLNQLLESSVYHSNTLHVCYRHIADVHVEV